MLFFLPAAILLLRAEGDREDNVPIPLDEPHELAWLPDVCVDLLPERASADNPLHEVLVGVFSGAGEVAVGSDARSFLEADVATFVAYTCE